MNNKVEVKTYTLVEAILLLLSKPNLIIETKEKFDPNVEDILIAIGEE